MNGARIGDIDRRLANIARVGKIIAADYSKARLQVAIGRNQTAWLPWLAPRAGNDKVWHPPEIGEQVLVLSPSGDMAQGYVLPGALFCNTNAANGSAATKHTTTYADGAVIEYDRSAHAYQVTLPSGSKATIAAGSNAKAVIENDDVTLSFGSNASIVINSTGITLSFGSVSIVLSSSGITTNGDITQTGKITASGTVTTAASVVASGDVTAGTVTLKTHIHPGVQTGSGSTGVGVG